MYTRWYDQVRAVQRKMSVTLSLRLRGFVWLTIFTSLFTVLTAFISFRGFLPSMREFTLNVKHFHHPTSNLVRRNTLLSLSTKQMDEKSWYGVNPGFGGYWPGDPNAKKYNVTILIPANGSEPSQALTLMVPKDRYIYFYFEEVGLSLPIVNRQRMCRQGCCTICTAKVINNQPIEFDGKIVSKGKVKMDSPLGILLDAYLPYSE